MLEFDRVGKRYGDTVALDDLTFAVAPGQMFGFVGANGAGKTTAMRIAMGVLAADSGEVRWRGEPVTSTVRNRFGYMPEERGLYPKMRVREHLIYLGRLHGLGKGAAGTAADTWIDRLGLAARRDDPVDKLSLGNQQRVQLAAALVHDPQLLILDEPFSGLDPVGVDTLAEALLAQCRGGVPVIFSSHQLELVERLCDAVGIINAGRMVAVGPVEELRRRDQRRRLRIAVPGAVAGWAERVDGVRVLTTRGPELLLELDDGVDDQVLLAEAVRSGRVEHFSWRRPTLVELFRDVVANGAGNRDGAV